MATKKKTALTPEQRRAVVSEYMSSLGKIGGATPTKKPKGVAKLSPEQRKKRAREAAAARWGKVAAEKAAAKTTAKKKSIPTVSPK